MNPYQAYQTNSTLTASPGKLTLMLYEGSIKFCNQAKHAIETNNIQAASVALVKAQNIVCELRSTLNMSVEISKDFYSLYTYIYELLIDANIKKSTQEIEIATELLRDFRDTWEKILK